MTDLFLFSESDNSSCPSSTSFQCDDGTCIPLSSKCDTIVDCADRSDEPVICSIKPATCNEGQFQCRLTNKCIPQMWVCDGDYDCGSLDTSDEEAIRCHTQKKCLPNESKCEGNVCLSTAKFCDGTFDCINDEYDDICRKFLGIILFLTNFANIN